MAVQHDVFECRPMCVFACVCPPYKTNITPRLFLSLSPSLCNFTLIVPEIDLSYIPKARYYISWSRILSPPPDTHPNPYTPSHPATDNNTLINGVVHPAL